MRVEHWNPNLIRLTDRRINRVKRPPLRITDIAVFNAIGRLECGRGNLQGRHPICHTITRHARGKCTGVVSQHSIDHVAAVRAS